MSNKIIEYFQYENVLKVSIFFSILLVLFSYAFFRVKRKIAKVISAVLLLGVAILLFSNNIIQQDYKMENSVVPKTNITGVDENRILENYAMIQTTYGAEKPTTWWEDGDYNVDNNLENYRAIEIDTAFIVHKQIDRDVTILQFYAYYTTNGESTIEGSSHLHDFSKYYLYFYLNETTAFAIGFSTYNYDEYEHQWIFREYIGYIDGHEILVHDVSTNEFQDEEIDYTDTQISDDFNKYEWNPKEMNEFEKIIFMIFSTIFIGSLIGFLNRVSNPRVNVYGEYDRGSGWIFLMMISGLFMIYFPVRTGSVYLTEFTFYYYDIDESPDSDEWEGGTNYIERFGGAPHLKSDWSSYEISKYEDLNFIYSQYYMGGIYT